MENVHVYVYSGRHERLASYDHIVTYIFQPIKVHGVTWGSNHLPELW